MQLVKASQFISDYPMRLGKRRGLAALLGSLLIHLLLFRAKIHVDNSADPEVFPKDVRITVRAAPKKRIKDEPSADRSPTRPRLDKATGGSPNTRKALPSNTTRYSDLLPTTAEGMAMVSDGQFAEAGSSTSGIEEFSVPTGDGVLISDQLALVLNIPNQLLEMYSTAHASIKMVRNLGKWQITSCIGEHFYRALLYERINPLIDEGGPVYQLLEGSERSEFLVSIEYLRGVSLLKNEVVSEWRQTKRGITLHIEEMRVPAEANLFSVDEDERGNKSALFNVIGAAIAAKNLVVGKSPEELNYTMRVLKNSPAYGGNCGREHG